MRMCVSVCVWVEHKAEQANPKQQQQLPLMRGLPASTQTSPAFPPTSFNTLDGFLRFVVAVAVAVAAGIEWLLHGVHFESEKSINFYCIRISVSHAATRRNGGDVNDDKEGNVDFGSDVRFLRTAAGTEACVWICVVYVCASRGLILVAKVIYLLVTRTGTWRGTRWPKLSQMANSWQFDNKAETASSCCCCNLAQVTRGSSEKEDREREGEGDRKRKTIQSLHWFALKCIYSSLLAFFLVCCCCCCCRCLWQLNVKFCPLAYVTKNGAQNGCQEHPLAEREKHT